MNVVRRITFYFTHWWSKRGPATRALPQHVWRALVSFVRNGGRQAAALSYYAVFSVFPLSLLLSVAVSGLLGPAIAQEQIVKGLQIFLPSETVNLLQSNLQDALRQSSSFGLVALVGLAWSALGLFSNLSSSLDQIFEVPTSRSMWRQRALAFLMTLILIILVIASFVTSGVLRLFSALLLSSNSWLSIAISALPLGLNMVIFALLFRFVPARRVTWDAVWPAAILGGAGWELAKAGFGWYLDNLANFSIVYGGIATVIVLLTWAYLIASIFLFSAELCAQLDMWFTIYHEPEALDTNHPPLPALPPEIEHVGRQS